MCSYLFPPKFYFLLFEVPPFFLVNQHQIQKISALESIVHVLICWSQICTCKIKSNWNALTFHWCSIHYFEFIQILSFSHCVLPTSNDFFSYYAQLHMFNFDSNKIKKHFSKDAVFQVEFAAIKLKLNMKAFFDADLHFDWSIVIRLC